MIRVAGLSKTYRQGKKVYPVFSGVTCEINKGDVVGIIGPSGCGKTTFTQCLMTLVTPDSGEIWFDGQNILAPGVDLNRVRKKMGMVFQDFNLFPHLSVLDNITLAPVKLEGIPVEQAEEEAKKFLKEVGLAECASLFPDQLSGGQKQRVAIARCLAMHPDIIFFDEPTSALDTAKKKEVASVIKKLAQQGMTMVIVTHEHKLVQRVCNRIFFFCQGELYEQGTVEEVFGSPKRMLTRAFVQTIFGMNYQINSRDYDLYNLNSELELYCTNNGLSAYINSLELVCEEVLTNFLPFSGSIYVKLKVAYNNTPALTILQEDCSEPILEKEGADEISLMLIKGVCSSVTDYQNGFSRVLTFEFNPQN